MQVKEDWIAFTQTCVPMEGERVLVKYEETLDNITNIIILYWQQKFLTEDNLKFIEWKRF